MENKENKNNNKPSIPKAPGSEESKKKAKGPNPNSDPNYSYYPNVPYPTGGNTERKDPDENILED